MPFRLQNHRQLHALINDVVFFYLYCCTLLKIHHFSVVCYAINVEVESSVKIIIYILTAVYLLEYKIKSLSLTAQKYSCFAIHAGDTFLTENRGCSGLKGLTMTCRVIRQARDAKYLLSSLIKYTPREMSESFKQNAYLLMQNYLATASANSEIQQFTNSCWIFSTCLFAFKTCSPSSPITLIFI